MKSGLKKRDNQKPRELTLKQQKFIDAFLGAANGNATGAAKLAGYSGSYDVLRRIGSGNLRVPEIRQAIDEALSENGMSAAEVLSELAKVGRLPANGDPKSVRNKVQALATLARYHGLLVDKTEHSGAVTLRLIDETSDASNSETN